MDGEKRPVLPVLSATSPETRPRDQKPPDNLVEHLQALGRAASAAGERLKDPENITLGELLRLIGLAR